MRALYIYLTMVLIVTATILVTYLYTSSHYAELLYAIYVLLLTPFSLLFIKAKDKSETLFIVIIILLTVRTLPRLSNIFSGYVVAPGDEGYDLSTSLITLLNGRLVYKNINAHNLEYINYPMLHVFTAMLSVTSNVDPLLILILLPQIISLTIFLLFYETFKGNDLSRLKLVAIIGVAFLLAGIHAQYWSTFTRESYASVFSTLLLLSVARTLVTSQHDFKSSMLMLVVFALTFSHFATSVYTILAMTLLLISLNLLNRFTTLSTTLRVKSENPKLTYGVFRALLLANLAYIFYNEFVFGYARSWFVTFVREIQHYPFNVLEALLNIGSRLQMFERFLIYIHYIALFSLLLLLLHEVSRNKKLSLKLFLFAFITLYFLLAYARFIPGQGRYPLTRFAHNFLFIYMTMSLILLRSEKQANFRWPKSLVVASALLILLALGYLAQVSPLFKYSEDRLNADPCATFSFIVTHTLCDFNLGYVVLEPYVPVDRYVFSLLDSHNTFHSVEYFQFSLSDFRVYGSNGERAINILVSSPKRGEPILQGFSIIYSSCDVVLQLV